MRDQPAEFMVHTPTHSSWLNQIEIWFTIVQRKVLTPAVADSLKIVARDVMMAVAAP